MTAFKKKVLAFALAGTFALSQTAFVNAAVDATETTNINKYDTVRKDMGLIQGDGKEVSLHKPLERYRAFVLYARMLGQGDDLQAFVDAYTTGDNFTDAAGQSPYVQAAMAYFKSKELSGGYSDGSFKPHDTITGQEFYKMMLEALGYKQDTDFTYEEVADKALELGLIADKEVAGANKLEEVQIGAALYDTLNATMKPAEDAAADAVGVKLAFYLAQQDATAVPYLAALDKVTPTLKVTEPHAIGSRNPGIADGATATDVTASATVDMHEGMPLKGTLSEFGTIYYDFNGVTGSFDTEADGSFDTTKMETPLDGTVDGVFPFINNNVETKNNNVVKIWAKDLAGNETKHLEWMKLSRTQEFVTGCVGTPSGSSIYVVSGSSVDLYFTVDLESTPVVKVGADAKTATEVKAVAVTAADVAAAKLTAPLVISTDADVKIFKAHIDFTDINTVVNIGATASANYGSVTSTNGKKLTFVSDAKVNLNPTVTGNAGGFIISFPSPIDVRTLSNDNFLRDGEKAKELVVLDDNKTVYAMYENVQSKEYATITINGVKSMDGTAVMASKVESSIKIVDTVNPSITEYKIMAPNKIRLYFSEPIIGDEIKKPSNYVINDNTLIGTIDAHGAYVDVVSSRPFLIGDNKVVLNFKDNGVFPFAYTAAAPYKFTYAVDKIAPVAELVKATNNYIMIRFKEDINPASVVATNATWSYSASKIGAVATAATCYKSGNQGYSIAEYYFTGSNMTIDSDVDFVFSGIRDMWGNVMPLTVVPFKAMEDKVVATPTFTIKEEGTGSVAPVGNSGIGDKTFRVIFDRPVKVAPNTFDNFVLKNKSGARVNTFASFFATVDGTVKQSTGQGEVIYGYKEYLFTLPSSSVASNGLEYNLTINDMVDVISGKTIASQTLPTLTVKDNSVPRVVSAYTKDNNIYVTFNVAMNADTVKNKFNYYYSNVSGGALNYLTVYSGGIYELRDNTAITLSSDMKTAIIPVKNNLPAGSVITVLGVKSNANDILISADNFAYLTSSALVGTTATIVGSNNVKVTGANKVVVTLSAGVKLKDVAYTDIDLGYYVGSDFKSLRDIYQPEFAYDTDYNNDVNGHTVITYTFTRYMAYQKDLFSPDGRVLNLQGTDYVAVDLYARTNGTQSNIVATDWYGAALGAGQVTSTPAVLVDAYKPVLQSTIADMGYYPIITGATMPSGAAASIYLGFNESIVVPTTFASGITMYNETLQKYLTPADFEVVATPVSDDTVVSKINSYYNYNRIPSYATLHGVNNVVQINVREVAGTYTASNVLRITFGSGSVVTDTAGNPSASLGTITAYTLR